jgi:hypothetical protein
MACGQGLSSGFSRNLAEHEFPESNSNPVRPRRLDSRFRGGETVGEIDFQLPNRGGTRLAFTFERGERRATPPTPS